LGSDGVSSIGFRYDFPDESGRIWRTEAVAKFSKGAPSENVLRIRTQCLASDPGAKIEASKKPFFIKTLIHDCITLNDGLLSVSDCPIFLRDDLLSLEVAEAAFLGSASEFLPVIYFSKQTGGDYLFSTDELKKLTYRLGGVAHVILEPSREFSFKLRDRVAGRNPYDGTIGICLPQKGQVRKFYLGGVFQNQTHLLGVIEEFVINSRSTMPSKGWDWSELQEQSLRYQRSVNRDRLSAEETEALYNEEIENLQERIKDLEEQLKRSDFSNIFENGSNVGPASFHGSGIPEIYEGEVNDRIHYLIDVALKNSNQYGLDKRSNAIADELLSQHVPSDALAILREGLKSAVKDPKRVGKEVSALLASYGYTKKSEKNHIRLEPRKEFVGLSSITVPKTPSENRGLKNLKSQIEGALGITNIK
jgi:hypothetical protein